VEPETILQIAQKIIKDKGISIAIDLDTKLYSTGILSSIDILDLLLRIQKQGIKTSHIKTNMFDSLSEIIQEI
jgi:CBS domain-containing protein